MKCPTPKTHSVYITGVNSCCDRPRELIHNPYYVCKRPQDIAASLFPLHTGLHSVPTAHWEDSVDLDSVTHLVHYLTGM